MQMSLHFIHEEYQAVLRVAPDKTAKGQMLKPRPNEYIRERNYPLHPGRRL
jgi:hypothetical protein